MNRKKETIFVIVLILVVSLTISAMLLKIRSLDKRVDKLEGEIVLWKGVACKTLILSEDFVTLHEYNTSQILITQAMIAEAFNNKQRVKKAFDLLICNSGDGINVGGP